jgi:hypothetical protein
VYTVFDIFLGAQSEVMPPPHQVPMSESGPQILRVFGILSGSKARPV